MGKRLFVGNLSYSIDSAALQSMFEEHGAVESATVITDRSTGQSKGFGFVEMSNPAEADAAIGALNGVAHGGRTLNVSEAKPREDRGGFGGGRSGGPGGGRGRY